ncbi:PAB-dependent poly(A)-specific ribonuclease subunit PAN2 [Jimgerdemannia flammicorona]|uniref:PAB-dependent poly(A)-specific ribonuclease subunit PAN2 n=1 Tax=Jimgerdemannia flammicorona TaxID=994334 RepID=A0A433D6T9_9FUNG|nr:PAB-dependent poly(A)-specific ribonuclease subunit PAN2 [Jimgerdemannia flammicorona]
MKTGSISSFDEDHMEQWDETDSAMPKCYRRVEIQYSRFGVDDFDFGYESVDTLIFYNKTNYGGLETHIANSYCNALLQVLYFTLLLRYVTKSHIGQPCPKENCLCCELGFLFRMLEDSKGQNCQASNFLKAFSTIPQGAWTQSKVTKSDCVSFETKCEIAAYRLILLYRLFLLQLADGLGLFEPETPEPSLSYSGLIQNFNRFILEQLHQETNTPKTNPKMLRSIANEDDIAINEEDGEVPSLIQQLFGLKTASVSQCSQCGNEAMRMTYPFVVDLSIPTVGQSKQFETVIPRKSFSDILHASLRRETPTKAFCTKCQQSQPMVARKILRGLPPVLTINSGVTSNEQAVFWRQYGEILEPNFTDGAGRVATESPWLPKRLGLKLNGNEFIVKELDREPLAQAEFEGDGIDCGVYELTSVVSQIQQEKDIPHLVSHVRG